MQQLSVEHQLSSRPEMFCQSGIYYMGLCSRVVTMQVFASLNILDSTFLRWQPDIKTTKIKMVRLLAQEQTTLMPDSKTKTPTAKVETLQTLELIKGESLAINQ
jgi:hypothetical protein